MTATGKLTPIFILAGLGAGLLCALSELIAVSSGANFILVAATGALITGCGIGSSRFGSRVPRLAILCGVLVAGMGVSVSTQDANVLTSGLCWTVLIATASFVIPLVLSGSRREGLQPHEFSGGLGVTVGEVSDSRMETVSVATAVQANDEELRSLVDAIPLPAPDTSSRSLALFDSKLGTESELEHLEDEFDEELETELADRDEQMLQSWSRVKSLAEERLEGVVLIEFTSLQRQRYVHFPFVPMLRGGMNAFCECDREGDFSAEIDQLHAYGVRVSIRRRGDVSETAQVELSLVVSAQEPQLRAA